MLATAKYFVQGAEMKPYRMRSSPSTHLEVHETISFFSCIGILPHILHFNHKSQSPESKILGPGT